MSQFLSNKKSKNTELVAAALCDFIFMRASKDIETLEHNEQFKETAVEFNNLPPLKRFLDICIIYFWLASIECQWYYEEADFNKICRMIEDNIYERFEFYLESNQILGLTLKDFVKGQEELEIFCSESPVPIGGETKVGVRNLLNFLLPKRFSDYNSTVSDQSFGARRRVEYFCQHVFGKEGYRCCPLGYLLIFPDMFSTMTISIMEFIKKLESEDIKDIKKYENGR